MFGDTQIQVFVGEGEVRLHRLLIVPFMQSCSRTRQSINVHPRCGIMHKCQHVYRDQIASDHGI